MKATCKHCRREFDVITYDGSARLPNHRLEGSLIACDGTGALVAEAGENYSGPLTFATSGKIPGRSGSTIADRMERAKRGESAPQHHPPPAPSFYDKEEQEAFDDEDFEF